MAEPPSVVQYYSTTLEDTHPVTGIKTTIVMANKMEAILTVVDREGSPNFTGSPPDGRALWWPAFQARHKIRPNFWVQGHLLNEHLGGPGKPENLVPISNTLNSNMCTMVEKYVKARAFRKIGPNQTNRMFYTVEAHWSQPPSVTRKIYGLIEDGTGTLLWGEQFAPTHLSWTIHEFYYDKFTGALLSTPMTQGSNPNKIEQDKWYNNFPD